MKTTRMFTITVQIHENVDTKMLSDHIKTVVEDSGLSVKSVKLKLVRDREIVK